VIVLSPQTGLRLKNIRVNESTVSGALFTG